MNIHGITIEGADADQVPATESFSTSALALGDTVGVRIASRSSTGFRGFAPSLILMQPADDGSSPAHSTRALAS